MEGEAISATIEVLVQNLINLSKEEISLIRGLDENADKLRDTFAMIQSFLEDAQTRSIKEEAVKTWLKKLAEKAFDADNALDELNYHLLSSKRKNKVPISCFPSFDHCVHKRDLAVRINEINASFESINKSATELGLQEKLAAAPAAVSDAAFETDSLTVDPIFIGRDDDVSKIVGMLTTPTEEAVLSIIPIVGMGGLGKTTLARNIFNHQKTKSHFGQRIWVHVSQDFDAVVILKKILVNLELEKVEVESRKGLPKKLQGALEAKNDDAVKKALTSMEDESKENVLKKIQMALGSKTYVLVLDDVWNEDQQKWEDFIKSWSGITSTKGNGIIVTTRNVGVGSLVKTHDMHLLNGLSKEECWSIIKDRAFEGATIASDLEDIGRSIAERCQGLPLAANVVGGVLRGKPQDEWHLMKDNWLSGVGGEENYISRILKLSFHHLSSPSVKKCFAYCSIFPKGARIDRVQLIQLWMSEGFLQPSQTRDMETVGNQFLKVFLQNSLLQVVDRDEYGDIKHCSMHDLVHDVAASILDDTYYKRDESSRIPKDQSEWYICWGCKGGESSRIPKVQAKWLRTLIYNGRISDVVFSDFKSLHALTLTDNDVKKLPDSIRELIHLRYLDISDTRIRFLPNSIGKLSHLQTIRNLNPSQGFGMKRLPSTLKQLFNLRHLYMNFEYTVLPPQLGMLTSLQTLPCFKVRNKDGHRILELGSLKNLKGELKIYNLENVQGEKESEKACMSQKTGIVKLVLRWRQDRKGEINDENVLKGIQPHPNLKMLEIDGFKGASFPTWTLKMAVCLEGRWVGLNKLTEIRLEDCVECEEIPTLGHLPHLKSLHLSGLHKVKCIGASFYGAEECSSESGVYKETISVFPALEKLELSGMHNLREWEDVKIPSGAQVKVFPRLECLEIWGCNQLRSAPSQFTSLKKLIIGNVDSDLPLASICSMQLKTLTRLQIYEMEGLESLPDWLFHNNQHLSMLNISYCPKLRQLPDGFDSLNSLEELHIRACDGLFSVGGKALQGLKSLRRLEIGVHPVLTYFIGEMEESCAPFLEELTIHSDFTDACDRASFNKAVDGILRSRSRSLRNLELWGKEDLEPLPDQLQHLTALEELHLRGFGIEELPEWFGNFSSLRGLYLMNCSKLKHLPSMEAMQRLTNLTTLSIVNCPLQERCNKQHNDSEWPKISHIPNDLPYEFIVHKLLRSPYEFEIAVFRFIGLLACPLFVI